MTRPTWNVEALIAEALVAEDQSATILAYDLGISRATVSRTLLRMEEQGDVVRFNRRWRLVNCDWSELTA